MPLVAQLSEQAAQASHRHHVEAIRRLIEQYVARTMHEGACQGGLDALALRESLGTAVRKLLHLEQGDHVLGARLPVRAGQSVQGSKVGDVFARRQVWIDACSMRQHSDAPPGLERVAHDADAVDERVAGIGCQDGVEDAQRGRLARAVGAQQAGNAAIESAQIHVAHGRNGSEVLLQVRRFDHLARIAVDRGITAAAR